MKTRLFLVTMLAGFAVARRVGHPEQSGGDGDNPDDDTEYPPITSQHADTCVLLEYDRDNAEIISVIKCKPPTELQKRNASKISSNVQPTQY